MGVSPSSLVLVSPFRDKVAVFYPLAAAKTTCSISERYCKVSWSNLSSSLLVIKSITSMYRIVKNCSDVNHVLSDPESNLHGSLCHLGRIGVSISNFSNSFLI